MRAKVKISILATGQEFLLLVAKMNLKGVLVFSPQVIPANSELLLELKLDKESPILLKGFVHKVSNEKSAKKGMVIAFLNPSSSTKASIEKFMEKGQGSSTPEKNKKAVATSTKKKSRPKKKKNVMKVTRAKKESPSTSNEKDAETIQPEKTVIVDNTLPALSLQSPDNKFEMMVSTQDEENVHHAGQGLAGETRHVQIHETLTRRNEPRKPFITTLYRSLGAVLVLVGIVLFFRHGVGWIEDQFDIKLLPARAQQQGNNLLPTITQVSPGNANNLPAEGSLDTVTFDDQGDFLKVTLLGNGNYNNFLVEKLKNPHRIVFTLHDITKVTQKVPMKVNKSPISKIDANIINGKTVFTMFMIKKDFMEFEAKPFPHAMDIFFYRE